MVTRALKAVVPVAEILGVLAAAAFVVLLFAKPTAGTPALAPTGAVAAVDGAAIYRGELRLLPWGRRRRSTRAAARRPSRIALPRPGRGDRRRHGWPGRDAVIR